jgi:predicted anti-sigma-YlaC factor YlaD
MNEQHLSPDLLVDYLHGELAPEDDALAHAHLSSCSACRGERDLEASLLEALRESVRSSEQEMPSLIKAAIWEQIRQAKPSPMRVLASWLRPALVVPALAILLVGGWFASPYGHPGTAPTIDAMYYLEAHAAQTAGTPLSEQGTQPALETSMIDSGSTQQLADAETSLASSALDGSR